MPVVRIRPSADALVDAAMTDRRVMVTVATTGGHRAVAAMVRRVVVIAVAALACSVAGCGSSGDPVGRQPPPAVTAAPLSPPITLTNGYRSDALSRIASALHETSEQIRSYLRAQPSATLMTLAKPAGLSQDQLAAAIRAALTAAGQSQIRSGTWTPSQAAQLATFWSAQPDPAVITQVSQWFRGTS
jgi:hypothetical protein